MNKTVIVDLDNTICNCNERLNYVKVKPKNWKAFYAGIENDKPIQEVIDSVIGLWHTGYKVVYCTGRPEDFRETTIKWFNTYLPSFLVTAPLYMRKSKDNRPDYIVKEELLSEIRTAGYNPVLAFEDRGRVVDMYRRNGIFVLNTNQGEDY